MKLRNVADFLLDLLRVSVCIALIVAFAVLCAGLIHSTIRLAWAMP